MLYSTCCLRTTKDELRVPQPHLALGSERREGNARDSKEVVKASCWNWGLDRSRPRSPCRRKAPAYLVVIGRCTKGPSSAAMITSPPNDWLWRYWLGGYNNRGPYRGSTDVALLSCPFRLQGLLTRHPPGSIGVDTAVRGYPRP
jgi:hypothetical protein